MRYSKLLIIFPRSSESLIAKKVTPVVSSPFSNALWIGAPPRQ